MNRCGFIQSLRDAEDPALAVLLAGLARDEGMEEDTRRTVGDILAQVGAGGLEAALDCTRRFDGFRPEDPRVPRSAMAAALADLRRSDPALVSALEHLIAGVSRFARAQRQALSDLSLPLPGGGTVGERWVPLRSAGVYVPGGRAFYPSTFAMTVLPAQAAGVERIVAVTPPGREGLNPLLLATAALLGVEELVTLGGAQAIAWLAYGAKVDLVAGPGNRFVAEAKRQLVGTVGIDSLAGPTELLVIADGSANPALLAEDLLAQAEHDPDAAAVLLSESRGTLIEVEKEISRRMEDSPRRDILRQSLLRHGRLIQVTREAALAFAQAWAPEHLQLSVKDPETWAPFLTTAGALFLGESSAEAFGDYGLGPNHVLPTARTARFASPLGVATFMKRQSLLHLTPEDAAQAAPWVERLARSEGLFHHAESVTLRNSASRTCEPIKESLDRP